jgi:hypothetical protein
VRVFRTGSLGATSVQCNESFFSLTLSFLSSFCFFLPFLLPQNRKREGKYPCPERSLYRHSPSLTNSMKQSPSSEANSRSASQEITLLLWNLKVRYRVHKSSLMDPIPSQMNPLHNFPPYFPNIRSNIILSYTPRSFELSLSFRSSNQNVVRISHRSHACYMRRPSHSSLI